VCGDSLLGVPNDTTLRFSNTGNDTLRIRFVTPLASTVTVLSVDSAIAPGASGLLRLRLCAPAVGSSSTQVTIASNATQDSMLTLSVSGTGVPYYPQTGSVFIYDAVQLDTAGHPIGSAYTITESIIASGISYQGKSNVEETSDSSYFHIEDNGYVSFYLAGFPTYPSSHVVGNGWITIPFGSHSSKMEVVSKDITFLDSTGNNITLTVRDSAAWVETKTVSAAGRTFTSSHAYLQLGAVYTSASSILAIGSFVEFYFSPEIGFTVQQNALHRQITVASQTGGGEGRRLKSYNLR
jgi:hypothetical protein